MRTSLAVEGYSADGLLSMGMPQPAEISSATRDIPTRKNLQDTSGRCGTLSIQHSAGPKVGSMLGDSGPDAHRQIAGK